MRFEPTPKGCAGADQVAALEESIDGQLEAMFMQSAKRRILQYGVGRTTMTGRGGADAQRLDAQRRECDASMMFHAGRALELALHVLYARGMDRILGRDYPEADPKTIEKDRKNHGLRRLYGRIVEEFEDRHMKDALEHVYHDCLHRGVIDVMVDGERVGQFQRGEDRPFTETKISRISDGTEMTLDHVEVEGLLAWGAVTTEFSEMPEDTFENFLTKADQSSYKRDTTGKQGRDGMRGAHYSARDHEPGRPYVVIGSEFFARLVRGIVELSHQPWTWNSEFARRCHERLQYNAIQTMRVLAKQNLREPVTFPELIPIDETMEVWARVGEPADHRPKDGYDYLHGVLEFESDAKPREASG